MKNKFLLLVAALVLSTTTTFASNPATYAQNASDVVNGSKGGEVTPEAVRAYLASYNIMAAYVCPESGTSNYMAKDVDGNWYRVYVSNGVIIIHEQVDY